MAIINSYPTATPTTGDLIIGTDTSTTPNSTKTFTVGSINALNITTDVKQLNVRLTPAQLLSLNGGNTIQLLAAPGAQKMYYILNGLINLKFNSVAYNFSAAGLSDVVTLQLGTVSLFNDTGLNNSNLNSVTDTFFVGDPINPTGGQAPVNVPINLTSTSGISVSQGNSDLNFSLLYREIDLSL